MFDRKKQKSLIDRARAGESSAQEQIVSANQRTIKNLCWRLMGNATDGDDLAQMTFSTFFRKLDKFRGDCLLSTYLYRLAMNECFMEKRRRNCKIRSAANTQSLTMPDDFIRETPDPFAFSVAEKIDLERAIDQLPKGYKKTLVLRDVHGYDHEEIARMMKVSVGTVKSQIHKARMKMRTILNKTANPRIYERKITSTV